MRPNPNLIPRFNLDYSFNDFLYGIRSIPRDNANSGFKVLNKIFGKKSFFFTNFGRTSLYVILKALNLKKGSKIGVPLYSCTVIFDAIVKAGYTPCFLDIDLKNYTLDPQDLKEKINDLSAVVVIHTFGRPAEMDKIMEIAGDLPVIEDCAHSLLSEYKGKLTGTIGDVSFFSLSKYISAGGGGMILSDDFVLNEKIMKEINQLEKSSVIKEIKNSFITYMKSYFYHKPWFGLFALPIGLAIEKKVDLMNNTSFEVAGINKTNLNLLFYKLLNFRKLVELQRMNSLFLIKELETTRFILPYEMKNTFCNYYLFPIRFNNKNERDKARKLLMDMGIDTAKLYNEVPLKAKKFYGYKGNCKNSEILAKTILTIPNYFTLKNKNLGKIAYSIRKLENLL